MLPIASTLLLVWTGPYAFRYGRGQRNKRHIAAVTLLTNYSYKLSKYYSPFKLHVV